MKNSCLTSGAGRFCLLLVAAQAWLEGVATPAFTRKYGTSCVTCHEAFPRRNIVGEAFRLNGYHFIDDELYVKAPLVELGDEAYERLWPKAIWPTTLSTQLPFSLINRFLLEVDSDGSRDAEVLFLFPEEIELVWTGTIGKTFSYYGDLIFIQKDFGGNDIQSWAQLKARVGIHDIVGPENLINLNIGTVGTQTMGLYPALDHNNYTTHYYQYSSWIMPTVNMARSGLSEFRGNPFSLQPQIGLELYGFGPRWKYAIGVVSGDVLYPADVAPDDDITFVGTGRNRGAKDGYAQVCYKIGGLGFDGSDSKVEDPTQASADYWRDDSLIMSAFGYAGSAQITTVDNAGAEWEGDDAFWRAGFGLQQKYKNLTVAVGYMYGYDDRPYGNLSPDFVPSHTWFAEATYYVFPWLLPYGRYEGLLLDLPENIAGLNPDQDTQRVVLGAKALVRANVSVNLETTLYTQGADLQSGFDKTIFLLFNLSF
ncbi:MAG: hypothetical protein H7A46_12365 [Verrucomicrobiales bacterium]|nr:hypothetical protein [Verrucomicrobiales bacterium]